MAAQERQKVEEYKSVLAPTKKIAPRDIQHGDDLHPSLRALQRIQQQNNIRREAEKAPVAFSPKHVQTGPGGTSPFSSAIGERVRGLAVNLNMALLFFVPVYSQQSMQYSHKPWTGRMCGLSA